MGHYSEDRFFDFADVGLQAYRRIKYKDANAVHRMITNKPATLRSDAGGREPDQ